MTSNIIETIDYAMTVKFTDLLNTLNRIEHAIEGIYDEISEIRKMLAEKEAYLIKEVNEK